MKPKILVVDDEPDIVLLMTRLLEPEGYHIITAVDGEDALHKIYTESPRIVLLDIILPKKDGYEVCQEIKSNGGFRDTVIIMFTVKIFAKDRERGVAVGADYYLTKPFSGLSLIALIKNILGE
jgi:two-component system alkaline phosphatase synthesis response regulator PhoP